MPQLKYLDPEQMFGIQKFFSPLAPEKERGDCGASQLRLEPKAAAVLAILREAGGETVSRHALLDRCWPPGQGSDEALTQAVAQVRRVLKDSPAQPRFVATVPRIGYRWVAGQEAEWRLAPTSNELPRLGSRILIGLALAAVGGVVALTASRQIWPREKLEITTEVRLGKDGQKQVVRKTIER